MKIIACIDDDFGLMFNNRRQSQDIEVKEDIKKLVGGHKLFMNTYSGKMFENYGMAVSCSENFLNDAGAQDYCFIENTDIAPFADLINEIILYWWNRKYPGDYKFDRNILDKMKLKNTEEFVGHSHEKILREIYEKQETKDT